MDPKKIPTVDEAHKAHIDARVDVAKKEAAMNEARKDAAVATKAWEDATAKLKAADATLDSVIRSAPQSTI